jgi:hypothetical protein
MGEAKRRKMSGEVVFKGPSKNERDFLRAAEKEKAAAAVVRHDMCYNDEVEDCEGCEGCECEGAELDDEGLLWCGKNS